MTETIGNREDGKAFEEDVWRKVWGPKSGEPVRVTVEQMVKVNPRLILRQAFDVGMKRGISKRGCCD